MELPIKIQQLCFLYKVIQVLCSLVLRGIKEDGPNLKALKGKSDIKVCKGSPSEGASI
jgi:hypothetical protein